MRNLSTYHKIKHNRICGKYQTYLLQLLDELIGGGSNVRVGGPAARIGPALGGVALHKQALEEEDELVAIEDAGAEQVEALEELGVGRVAAGQRRLVRQELLPREVGPSALEEGRLGGGGLDGELGDHPRSAVLGRELGGVELVAARWPDGLEGHDAVDGRAADLALLLLGSGLGGPEGDGIAAGPVQGGRVGGAGRAVRHAGSPLPAPSGRAVDASAGLGGVGPLPRLGDLGHLLELGLGLGLDGVGEEVGEVLEEVGMVGEEGRHLVEDVLDAPLLLLVRVEDLQELLVRFGLRREALLDGGDVVDGVIELDGLLRIAAAAGLLLLRRRRTGSGTHRRRRLHALLLHRLCSARRTVSRMAGTALRLLLSSGTCASGSSSRGRLLDRRPQRMARRIDVRHAGLARAAVHGEDLAGLVARQLNLVPLGQKGVEPQHQPLVALEQAGNSPDDARRVDLLRLERLHDVEELVVDLRPVAELHLDLIQVHEGVLDAQFAHHGWWVAFGLAEAKGG